jgi:hypothetical protein
MPTVRAGDLPYQPYNSEEPSPQVPSAYENIRSTPADFGETIGAATERLGTVIGQGANVLAEGAIARQQLENQVRADDQTNKYQEAVTKILHGDPDNPTDTGFLGKRGEDAMRDYNATYKGIVDLRNTMRSQLANDRQRLSFDNESRRTQILTLSRMGEHYDREFKVYGTAVNHAAALGGMTQAADAQANGDQAGFDAGVAKRMTADLKQAQLMGVANDPDVVNNILRNARSDVTKLQFKELSETNPYKAWQFLEVNKDALEPGELHTLRQSIAAKYYDLRGKIDSKEMPAPEGWDSKAPFPVRQVHSINTADPVEHFLGLAELHESHGQNIFQQVVGPQGGYNPSVGRVTGPSSAQGYFQITNTTWKDFAPGAGVDLGKYPNALSAPYEVQKAVARNIVTTSGVQHWTNYNSGLRQAVAFAGLPTSGPISGGAGPTSVAPATQAGTPANIDMAFGDSNAQLATNHGIAGKEDTVVGEQPSDTLARMVARGKDYFAGKNVIISGPTNNPDDLESVEKQAAFLQDAKARFVLPGVGPGIPGGKEKADLVNAQLAGIAQKYGGVFVMPDNWQSKDNYHIAQVPKFLEKAKAALGGGGTAPQVTARGAPAPGPSGSSIPPEAYLVGGGGDTTEGSGGSSPDSMVGTPNKIPGLKYAPIEPPEPGQLPDAQIPGLSERIAEIAKEPWAKDDPVRMNAAIKAARQGANIRWTDSQRQLQLHREQMKAQGDAVDDSYMKRMYPGSPNPPSVQEVQQDKRLDMHPDVKRKIISFMERENKQDPVAQVSKGNTMELYRRMTLPDGAEGKFANEQPIEQAYVGQQVTRQDHDWLIKEFREQRSAGNESLKDLKNRMITAAKPAILGPYAAADERLIEPDAAIKLFGYTEAINSKIKEYQDAGKNPADLFNTKNKDFVGSDEFIHPYASTLGDQARARARARDMGITPGGPPIPPPMGVPPPDFSKIPDADLIMGINSKKFDADLGIKELERRGYGRRAAPPVAPAPSTGMQ